MPNIPLSIFVVNPYRDAIPVVDLKSIIACHHDYSRSPNFTQFSFFSASAISTLNAAITSADDFGTRASADLRENFLIRSPADSVADLRLFLD